MSDFKPRYTENSGTLWAPSQTGSFSLTNDIKFWLDADHTASFVTGTTSGYTTISTAEDRIADIQFFGDSTYPPVYNTTGSLGADSEIGQRPTIWFSNVVNAGSQPIRNNRIGRMTSSVGAINGKLPGGNNDRSVFYVARYNGWRTAVANFAWQYGDNFANETYGLAGTPLGSADQESGWAHSSGTLILPRFGSTADFSSSANGELTVSKNAGSRLYYQFHSSSATGAIFLNGLTSSDDEYAYTGVTLATDTGSDGSFFFGSEVEATNFKPHWVLGEMIILDGVPSDDDRQRIEGYLAWKWDLTGSLPDDHPYHDVQPLNITPAGDVSFTFTGANVAPYPNPATGTFSVQRQSGSTVLTASIDVTGTAVAGADYTDIFPLNLTWELNETGSKDFTVTFLTNPETTKTFEPFIASSGEATIVTPATSSTNIIYPGFLEFSSSAATIVEGENTLVTVNRQSGSHGALTGTLEFVTGSNGLSLSDLTFNNIDFGSAGSDITGTIFFEDGATSYQFAITASDDTIDESTESASFGFFNLNYPLSTTRFFPTASVGDADSFVLTVTDNETGSLNFGPDFVGPIYVTGTQNLTYSVDRTIAGDFATTATIALSGSTTAVEGLDYTGSTFPLDLSWADQETGSKTFTVNFLNNSETTGTLFVPVITSSTAAVDRDWETR